MKRRRFFQVSLALTVAGCSGGDPKRAITDAPNSTPENLAQTADSPTLTFGVIADPQYADQPNRGTRFYRNSIGKLTYAIDQLNREELDLVVTLGDVIDKHFESFSAIMPLYKTLRAPHCIVLGNHDFDVDASDKHKVPQAMGFEKNYYSQSYGSWHLIFLDGTDVATFRYPPEDERTASARKMLQQYKNENAPNAFDWNSAIGLEQMFWLDKELKQSKAANQRAIVFCHQPILPADGSHNLWNAKEIVNLLDQYDHVAAYMNGHDHGGNYAERRGTHFVNFKGMVETKNENAYAIVRCFVDRIEIDGFGLEPDQSLN